MVTNPPGFVAADLDSTAMLRPGSPATGRT